MSGREGRPQAQWTLVRVLVDMPPALALVLILAVLLTRPLAAHRLEFSAIELPPVPTALGAFDSFRPVALNNRGQVAGTARGPADGNSASNHKVAFLYEPREGSHALDPYASWSSSALFLNEKGQVLGRSCCGSEHRYQFFLASGQSKFNRLRKGWHGRIRDNFHPTALTDRGDIAGLSGGWPSNPEDPHVYRRLPVVNLRGHGWIDLSEHDDRLLGQPNSTDLEVLRLNRFRDFVIPTTGDGVMGSFAGGEPIQISPADLENTVGELSDAAEVVGEIHVPSVKYKPAGPARAYLFTPAEGLIEIHDDRFLNSRAVWITSTGTVGGYATKQREWHENDRLFTYRRSRGLRVTNMRRELHRAHRKRKFGSCRPIDMNEKLQFIGEIQTRKKGDNRYGPFTGKVIHYLMDPAAGLIDLQEVLDDRGLEVDIFWLVDLNDEGQILIEAWRRHDRSRTAILLTPK